ncbi:MAG TPA: type II toxin-antitoxin system death-on-curing family toxin [Chloroflexota bacterium]|nr:type II toxin-antitoxin system death-on-curing family toxin [Chloroflexota bacterium]
MACPVRLGGDAVYLDVDSVIAIYARLFGCSFQQAAAQVRDPGLLESAVLRPRTFAHYKRADLASQAAALAHGIAEHQVFFEGNKRTALVALQDFLRLNGYRLVASQAEIARWIIGLSRDVAGLSVEEFADQIRSHLEALF